MKNANTTIRIIVGGLNKIFDFGQMALFVVTCLVDALLIILFITLTDISLYDRTDQKNSQ